jgi:hypothetical protein
MQLRDMKWEFPGSRLYPIAEEDRTRAGTATKVRPTGESRPPKKGEWFLSGSTVEGYFAPNDLTSEYPIAVPVSDIWVKAIEKAEQDILKAETEAIIRHALEDLPPRLVTVLGHHSTEAAWLTYGDSFSMHKEGGLSWSDLLRIVAALPPIPAEIRRDGCTSICPESRSEKGNPERTPIAPVTFWAHSPHYSNSTCSAHWFSEVSGIGTVRVGVYLRREDRPVEQTVRYKSDSRSGTVTGIESKSHRFPDWWPTGGKTMRYAGGSHTDPGTVVRYFDRGEGFPVR